MAYASWSVVFGEQPSAAKWNILGTNDASFNDGSGIASLAWNTTALSHPYKFRAFRNAALTLTASAATKLVFDSKSYDTNNNFATGTYTAPLAGFYHFSGRMSASTTRIFLALYKNGAEVARGTDNNPSASSIGAMVSDNIQLALNDTVEIWYFSAGAVSLDVGAALAYFSGFMISRT